METRTRVGTPLGAARTGLSVDELPPGQAVGPDPYENLDEEWLLVDSGRRPSCIRAARTNSNLGTSSSFSVPPEHTSCGTTASHCPRRDVLLYGSGGRCRRIPGQRHGLGLDSRRRSGHGRQTKQRRGRRSAVDCEKGKADAETSAWPAQIQECARGSRIRGVSSSVVATTRLVGASPFGVTELWAIRAARAEEELVSRLQDGARVLELGCGAGCA